MTADLLTADELAKRLKVQPSTVRRWHRDGKIPSVRLTPKVVRFDLGAVLDALTSDGQGQEVTPCTSK